MWNYYSYYTLLRKDPKFNCLKHLACIYKNTICDVTIVKNNPTYGTYATASLYRIIYEFVPVAEVQPGVFIRGGVLKNSATGEFYPPYSNYPYATFRFTPRPSGGDGSITTGTLHSYYAYAYETPRTGSSSFYNHTVFANIRETNNASYPLSRLQFDPQTLTGTVNLVFDASILSVAQSVFAIDYPSQSYGLDTLGTSTFGEVLSFAGDPSKTSQTIRIGAESSTDVINIADALYTLPFVAPAS